MLGNDANYAENEQESTQNAQKNYRKSTEISRNWYRKSTETEKKNSVGTLLALLVNALSFIPLHVLVLSLL